MLSPRFSRSGQRGAMGPGRLSGARSWAAGPRSTRLLASCGIAGPVLFTAAWVASSLRQTGYSATTVQLSGLAAVDARDPQIMMAGFIGLGVCSIAFGAAVGRAAAAGPAGPWLVKSAGAAAIAAGVFRRDHVLLTGPGFAGESWHNQVHDLVSGLAYAAMIAAPLVLARGFRADPDWAGLRRPLQVLALLSGLALALFASRAVAPWNGLVQRAAVTLPLTAEMLIAARMLTRRPGPGAGAGARPGRHAAALAESSTARSPKSARSPTPDGSARSQQPSSTTSSRTAPPSGTLNVAVMGCAVRSCQTRRWFRLRPLAVLGRGVREPAAGA